MSLRPLEFALATCLVTAVLLGCSPPVPQSNEAPTATEDGASEAQPETSGAGSTSPRPERRAARSASGDSQGQYRYIDERGQVQLAARIEDIPESQRSTASKLESAPARSRPRAQTDDVRAISDANVTIFTTQSCGYCRAAIAHFEKIGVDYVNRDVEADEEARDEYLELTGGRRGVPVIVVGETWMQGWSRHEFDRLLASAR